MRTTTDSDALKEILRMFYQAFKMEGNFRLFFSVPSRTMDSDANSVIDAFLVTRDQPLDETVSPLHIQLLSNSVPVDALSYVYPVRIAAGDTQNSPRLQIDHRHAAQKAELEAQENSEKTGVIA